MGLLLYNECMPAKSPQAIAKKRAYGIRWRKDHPNYHSNYRKNNPDRFKEWDAHYYQNNRHKVAARQAVSYAVKTGRLIRPERCSGCGDKNRIEADHEDYSKPLEVVWLCRLCHLSITRKRHML